MGVDGIRPGSQVMKRIMRFRCPLRWLSRYPFNLTPKQPNFGLPFTRESLGKCGQRGAKCWATRQDLFSQRVGNAGPVAGAKRICTKPLARQRYAAC